MQSRTIVFVAFGLLILGILAVAFVVLSLSRPAASVPNTNEETPLFPSGGDGSISPNSGPAREINTTNGTAITVPDFTATASSVRLSDTRNDLQYDLTPYPDYVEGQPYPEHTFDVQFNERDQTFVVSLMSEPLGNARRDAELFLQELLNVPQGTLCTLSVLVGVPHSVNAQYATYQNLGLSSCPNAVVLP